jgi:hypothetical protein
MRRISLLFLGVACALFAEQKPEAAYTYWDIHPLHVGGETIFVGQAPVTNTHTNRHQGQLTFNKNEAFLSILLPVSRTIIFIPRFEYSLIHLHWDQNPKFNQQWFEYFKPGLILFTNELDRWEWLVRADYNFDTKHFSEPMRYGLFQAVLWGKYEIFDKWHYHVGSLGYVGLEGGMVYPIIGFDYAPSKNWLLKAIFPIVYSVEYRLGEYWRFALIGRPLKERCRTGKDEPQPESIFSYSTMSAELNIRYEIPRRLEIAVFGGCNFGGDFYIKNSGGHKPLYTDVSYAPYIGARLDWGI